MTFLSNSFDIDRVTFILLFGMMSFSEVMMSVHDIRVSDLMFQNEPIVIRSFLMFTNSTLDDFFSLFFPHVIDHL